jgi:Na+/melibiose symporter-like transporter
MASVAGSAPASADPATHVKIPFDRLVAYSTLQLPIAMAGLPVIVNVPKFYGEVLGLSLPALAVFLMVTRIIDALQDPVIGFVSDRLTRRRNGRLLLAGLMVPLLGAGFVALFAPPSKEILGTVGMSVWLVASLIVVHLGYSGVSISYHAHGAELSDDYNERTKVTVGREVFGLIGMTLAVVLPALLTDPARQEATQPDWLDARASVATFESALSMARTEERVARTSGDQARLAQARADVQRADATLKQAQEQAIVIKHRAEINGYEMFGMIFVPILLLAAIPSLFASPPSVHEPVPRKNRSVQVEAWLGTHGSRRRHPWVTRAAGFFLDFGAPLKNPRFRRLLLVFVVNGSALGIAASVMLFFVEHVLKGTNTHAGIVLLTYFLSGALSVPMWLWLSRRISKAAAWFIAMVLSILAFAGVIFLGAGDIWIFVALSVLTGMGIGADYGLPPSILADVIHASEGKDSQGETGAYFGLWALVTKLATAIGALMSLPIAALLGFNPGRGLYDTNALLVVYVLLPILVKLLAAALIWHIRIEALRPAVKDVLLPPRVLKVAAGK